MNNETFEFKEITDIDLKELDAHSDFVVRCLSGETRVMMKRFFINEEVVSILLPVVKMQKEEGVDKWVRVEDGLPNKNEWVTTIIQKENGAFYVPSSKKYDGKIFIDSEEDIDHVATSKRITRHSIGYLP